MNRKIKMGDKNGILTVLSFTEPKLIKGRNISFIKVKCDCGIIKEIRSSNFGSGNIKSCGCLNGNPDFHKLSTHPLYSVWESMVQRCCNPKSAQYQYYGGRGIKMCEEWRQDFMSFYNWALNNGWKKGLKTDRIDNNGNYESSNCHFVTHAINMRNTRRNNIIEFNGVSKCMTDWAISLGIKYCTLFNRIHSLGWTLEKALTTHKM